MSQPRDHAALQTLTRLAYELLDAHADTSELAGELVHEPLWAAHLDYLRVLQRKGREALAAAQPELSISSGRPSIRQE